MNQLTAGALRHALLRGDADAVRAMLRCAPPSELSACKDTVLHEVTRAVLHGVSPFCQLAAVCEAALPLQQASRTPRCCCGGLPGCDSPATHGFLMMLLRGWDVPVLDLGLNAPVDAFLCAAAEHRLTGILCTAFTPAQAEGVHVLHRAAVEHGLRGQLCLLLGGAAPAAKLPVDNTDFRLAAVAEEAARRWRT